MNPTIYRTQPGTIPHRAIEHLKTLPPGTEISTAVLAEAIHANLEGFTVCMKTARDSGLVTARHEPKDKWRLFWSLGNGKDLPKPIDYVPIMPAPVRERRKPEPKPANPAANRHFRAGLFTDGTLHMEVGDDRLSLNRAEAMVLGELYRGVL